MNDNRTSVVGLGQKSGSDGGISYETEIVSSLKLLSKFLIAAVLIFSVSVILAWVFFTPLVQILPTGFSLFKIEVAVAFIFLCLSLWLILANRTSDTFKTVVSIFLSLAVLLIGLVFLSTHVPAGNNLIEDLLVNITRGVIAPSNIPNVPLSTVLNFIFLSISIVLAAGHRFRKASQFFGVVVLLNSIVFLTYRLFGLNGNYGVEIFTPASFILLGISALFVKPEEGITVVIASQSSVGIFARRLMVMALLLPIFVCYLVLMGQKLNYFSINFGLAFLAIFMTFISAFIIWVGTNYLQDATEKKIEEERRISLSQQFSAFSLQLERSKVELETANKDLKDSQERLKTVFDNSPNIVFIRNKQGFYEFINKKFEVVFHVSNDKIRGKTGVGFFPRDVIEGLGVNEGSVFDRGDIVNVEEKMTQDDGVIHTYFVTKFPLFDGSGKPRAVCGIGTDITSIKDYENVLISEKIKKEAILDSVGDGLIATDPGGKLILMNRACQEMTGWNLTDFADGSWTTKVVMEDENNILVVESSRPTTRALTTKEKIFCDSYYYVRKDGSRFPTATTATPIIFHGEVIGAIESFRDITKERELDRAKDEFVSMVSHELKAPMTAIKGGLAVILKGDYGSVGKELGEILTKMFDYVGRLLNLVEDILKVSRIEAGALKPALGKIEIKSVVVGLVDSLQVLASEKNIKLTMEDFSDRDVWADPTLVNQVVTNLISNAIKFTDKGSVTVFSRVNGDYLEICVRDTGVGILLANQGKLFGKFQQIPSNKVGRPQGTGLGLYISRHLARLMGGDLWIDSSEEGKGSVFAFSVPLAPPDPAKEIKNEADKSAVSGQRDSFKN